ncbi:MAG TPA: hypothetical protein VFF52_21745 [Isosphaeraceae bacterium]|nr:hypothetical protein [Isosphaeraceae bacterium]
MRDSVCTLVRGAGGFRLTAMALALGTWGLSSSPAMAQGRGVSTGHPGVLRGQVSLADSGSGGPATGVPGVPPASYAAPAGGAGSSNAGYGGYGLGYGSFGLGYPGYGLEYGRGCVLRQGRYLSRLSLRNWCSYVLGRENLAPYVADPYSVPTVAFGYWPPYAAPTASAANPAAR